ncbi:hypothetical protein [Neomegalonema sp.]|nr:hypothetical protein [Neomegalonema sp.]MDD2869628.1 hypothetical protein [Neomegalonema sp.]
MKLLIGIIIFALAFLLGVWAICAISGMWDEDSEKIYNKEIERQSKAKKI